MWVCVCDTVTFRPVFEFQYKRSNPNEAMYDQSKLFATDPAVFRYK